MLRLPGEPHAIAFRLAGERRGAVDAVELEELLGVVGERQAARVDDGAEAYVYRQNGDHFDRVPVRVLFRDSRSAVVENDGALYPGDVIAGRGAYQMHLALKNKSGGAIDPHAGHHH